MGWLDAGCWLADLGGGQLSVGTGLPACVRVCVYAGCLQLHARKGFYRRPITSPVQGNTEFAVWVPGSAAVAHHTSGDEGRRLSS